MIWIKYANIDKSMIIKYKKFKNINKLSTV